MQTISIITLALIPLTSSLRNVLVKELKINDIIKTLAFYLFSFPWLLLYIMIATIPIDVKQFLFFIIETKEIFLTVTSSGILMAVGWLLTNQAISKEDLSIVTPLQSLTPIIQVLLGICAFDTVYKFYHIDEKINIKVVIGVWIFFCGFLYHFIHTLYKVRRTISKRRTINSMMIVVAGATLLSLSGISSRIGIHIKPEYKEVFVFWSTIIATICLSSGTIFYYLIFKKNIPDPLETKTDISFENFIYLIIIGLLTALVLLLESYAYKIVTLTATVSAFKRCSMFFDIIYEYIMDYRNGQFMMINLKKLIAPLLMFLGCIITILGNKY